MGIKELRESGLLESFVTGTCTPEESIVVKNAILEFPELKEDIQKIGSALEHFAKQNSIAPPAHIKSDVLNKASKLRPESLRPKFKNEDSYQLKLISALGLVTTLLFGFLYFNTDSNYKALQSDYDDYKLLCDSVERTQQLEFALLNDIQDPNNEILAFTPTAKFNEASFYLISNSEKNKNFIQISNLPAISSQQSYQLWSLKPNLPPIPLTVFQGDEGIIIPVDYEDGTATYALTIEPLGGQQSPSLENLIGTVTI